MDPRRGAKGVGGGVCDCLGRAVGLLANERRKTRRRAAGGGEGLVKKHSGARVWRTILVFVLWGAVPLIAAAPRLTPPWFSDTLSGVPFSVWIVVALLCVFVCLTGFFSTADDRGEPRP